MNLDWIEKEVKDMDKTVQMVTSGISEKFVPMPNRKNLLGNLLVGLKRFRNVVRWKEFILLKLKENDNKDKNSTITNSEMNDLETNCISNQERKEFPNSLRTNLKPSNTFNQAPVGSNMLENFLKEVKNTLIDQVYNYVEKKKSLVESKKFKENAISSSILTMLKKLRQSSTVVISTDKTNNFVTISFYKYTNCVLKHISKCGLQTSRSN